MKTEILYGIHPVYEALMANRRDFYQVWIAKDKKAKRLEKIRSLAASKRLAIIDISSAKLKSIVGVDQHQGIAAKVSPYPLAAIPEILNFAKFAGHNPFLLLLDNIVDPHNLGALVRSALGVGIDGVIIPKDRSASPTPAVSKISAGALEHINLAQVTNTVRSVKSLKDQRCWIVGMDQTAEESIFCADLTGPLGIIIGGEEKGIRPLVKKNCDFLISIPQLGPVSSLNASVAGAIVMYESFRQRQSVKK